MKSNSFALQTSKLEDKEGILLTRLAWGAHLGLEPVFPDSLFNDFLTFIWRCGIKNILPKQVGGGGE